MADLFSTIIPSILKTKEPFIHDEYDERTYPSYMVNKALSYYRDTVLAANIMNMYPDLDKKLQADFYLNIIRASSRRYVKWHKKAKVDDLSAVKEYYGYSDAKAMDVLDVLTESQIAEIKEQVYKGD